MEYTVNDFPTRYFAGIELIGGLKVNTDDYDKIPGLWDDFRTVYVKDIPNKTMPLKYIGLGMYRFDFLESKTMDYFALVQIEKLFDIDDDEVVTKKLPKGRYISFSIDGSKLKDEVEKVYKYIEDEQINIHLGFDVKEYFFADEDNDHMLLSFKLED